MPVETNSVREALEPLIRLHDEVFREGRREDYEDDRAVWGFNSVEITYGDLRRARTAYDAIGAGSGVGVKTPQADDWGDLALQTAESILYYLGHGADASKEPGADRHRDELCRIIEAALSTHTAAGTAPVEEADAKAVAVDRIAQWLHDEVEWPDPAFPNRSWPLHDEDTGLREGGYVKLVEMDVVWQFRSIAERLLRSKLAPPHASTIPSEPGAKGEAGAGLAEPRRMVEGCCSAISPCGHQQRDPYSICDICTRAAVAAPVGEAVKLTETERDHHIALFLEARETQIQETKRADKAEADLAVEREITANLQWAVEQAVARPFPAARPVEEPGGVERSSATAMGALYIDAEAELAETRERLEKVEGAIVAADRMAGSCINFLERLNPFGMPSDDEQQYHAALDACRVHYPAARAALSTQESSAAPAGDGNEAGR